MASTFARAPLAWTARWRAQRGQALPAPQSLAAARFHSCATASLHPLLPASQHKVARVQIYQSSLSCNCCMYLHAHCCLALLLVCHPYIQSQHLLSDEVCM